jgi:hypothetical protein
VNTEIKHKNIAQDICIPADIPPEVSLLLQIVQHQHLVVCCLLQITENFPLLIIIIIIIIGKTALVEP